MSTSNIYETVTNAIVEQIERGAGEWRMPWHSHDGLTPSVQPVSVSTGKRYRGLNTILLWCAAESKGYDSALWGTFKAWKQRGASVNKGEKATLVTFWKSQDVTVTNDDGTTETRKAMFARGYHVFNVAQVSGFKGASEPAQPLPLNARIEGAERFFAAIPAEVRHGGNRAYCSRARGHIQLPNFAAFDDAESYYATRGHETVHWSGHEPRLNRTFGKRFGDLDYAAEELIAELGAAFLCAHLSLSNEPRKDHAQYLASWLKVLKSDKRAIFTAASQAQKAVDYLVNLAGEIVIENTDDDDDLTPVESAPVVTAEPVVDPVIPVSVPAPAPEPVRPFNRQWQPDPNFKPAKRSTRTGRKLRWRQYYGYKPHDGLNYPPMSPDALRRQARLYQAWLDARDAARLNEEMPLAAD